MTLNPAAITVVIVEDLPIVRKNAAHLLGAHPGVQLLGSCATVADAIPLINREQPALLLLDIQLPDGTGFDILQHFWPPAFKVIFLTAFQEHAIRAIKYGALDYLLKPLDPGELTQALGRMQQLQTPAIQQLQVASMQYNSSVDNQRLVIRTSELLHVLQAADIIYLQASGVYTIFFLGDGRKIVSSKNIKVYEETLPQALFIRPHQSYIVNTLFIEKYHTNGYIILKGNIQIPVATRRKELITTLIRKLR
ncbi:LytR/AlgR family response regulator transcription factor [Chitinophaga filiformis]|uniref:LytTR family DNA-binding domain-containing protein n=1 Tax=Chitinophaga filiformis TaxID=104663 RepID=A0ABY4HWQ0_CHIFI|nr:LytTR family DNA-binding domain-containing protein [Chitinophaga filiformis]UPK68012.1 LytTR family DNA-binding domain-containing protein [Chitinophaga filiformis]